MVIVQHPSEPNENEPPRYGRMIEFGKRRDAGTAYMAYSDRVGPGVVLLHEFFGLTKSFKRYADALCEAGFTVLAPDLYDGFIARNGDIALKTARSMDAEHTMRRLKTAAAHLTDNWHPRLGVVGFSLGAGLAGEMAKEVPLEGAVLYYGTSEVSDRWGCPVLAHWAETDEWEPADEVGAFIGSLEGAGVEVDSNVYGGTGHWFANSDVPTAYDPDAASLAFERTVDFLHQNLA